MCERNDGIVDALYDAESGCLLIRKKTDQNILGFDIFDASGELQLSLLNDKTSVDMEGFKPGIYFVRFRLPDKMQVIKFILK